MQVDHVISILKKPEYKDVKFVIFSKWLEPIRQLVDRFKSMGIMHGEITGLFSLQIQCLQIATANFSHYVVALYAGEVKASDRINTINTFTQADYQYVLLVQVS
jgi:hypothetical protein